MRNNILPLHKTGNLILILKVISVIIISFSLISCSSRNSIMKKTVNTRKEISTGLQKGKTIYFLCEYILSQPGTTILPMYLHSPGAVYYDKVFLYSFEILKNKLTQIAEMKPTSSYAGRGSVDYAKWADVNSRIYFLYSTGWDKKIKKYIKDIFSYDLKSGKAAEHINSDNVKILNSYFSSKKIKNIIPMTEIMYYTGGIPEDKWQLPSPLEFSTISINDYDRIIIEQIGDRLFKEAVFQIIRQNITEIDAAEIITFMEEWKKELPGDKQMVYAPYMERWSAKLSIAAKINAKKSHRDKQFAGSTELMLAAFTDNTRKLIELLKTTDINSADKNGCTALMYSIFGRAPHCMEFLMNHGADLMQETNSGYNAWMFVSNTSLRRQYLKLKKQQ
ncbi:MAG: ankyrin repeat domain-containing protein [Spirochaetes bacterium]|nr:ankyrin repeat domain-containing protein [Spirochaetota bacterium]